MKKLLLFLMLCSPAFGMIAGQTGQVFPGTITGTTCVSADATNSGTIAISVTGSWSGTLQVSVQVNSDPGVNVSVVPAGSIAGQTTITANGFYYASSYGGNTVKVCGNTVTNTASILLYPSEIANRSIATTSSAASLTSATANGATLTEKSMRWPVVSNPAAGSQATASKAAGGAGVRHVADCVSFASSSVVAPALTALTVNLRDGATGAGTIIWTQTIAIGAATGQNTPPFSVCGLALIGTANTAMTLEFSAALASLSESVSISGYDVN